MSKKQKDKDKVSQQEGGNISEGEDAERKGLADDLQPNLPARRVEFPLHGISFDDYRQLMDTLVRYVEPHGYYAIADSRVTLDRVALIAEYRQKFHSAKGWPVSPEGVSDAR